MQPDVTWTYLLSQTADEPCGEIYTIGYYTDEGKWIAASDWATAAEALAEVLRLEGRDHRDAVMRPRAGHPIADVFMQ
jgi:hypothetical protein